MDHTKVAPHGPTLSTRSIPGSVRTSERDLAGELFATFGESSALNCAPLTRCQPELVPDLALLSRLVIAADGP